MGLQDLIVYIFFGDVAGVSFFLALLFFLIYVMRRLLYEGCY